MKISAILLEVFDKSFDFIKTKCFMQASEYSQGGLYSSQLGSSCKSTETPITSWAAKISKNNKNPGMNRTYN